MAGKKMPPWLDKDKGKKCPKCGKMPCACKSKKK